jgi:hypothetical protein
VFEQCFLVSRYQLVDAPNVFEMSAAVKCPVSWYSSLRICAKLEQHFDELFVLVTRCTHQGRVTIKRRLVDVGATLLDKAQHDTLVPLMGCRVQGRPTIVNSSIYVGSTHLDEASNDSLVPPLGCNVQGRVAIARWLIYVGTTLLDKAQHESLVPLIETTQCTLGM